MGSESCVCRVLQVSETKATEFTEFDYLDMVAVLALEDHLALCEVKHMTAKAPNQVGKLGVVVYHRARVAGGEDDRPTVRGNSADRGGCGPQPFDGG